jgi:hypothetical protein
MNEEKLVRSIYIYVTYFVALLLAVVGSFILIKAIILNAFVPLSSAKDREIGNTSLVFCNTEVRREKNELDYCENDKKRLAEGWYKRELVSGFSFIAVSSLVVLATIIITKRIKDTTDSSEKTILQLEAPSTKEEPVKMVRQVKSQMKKKKTKK